MSDEEITIAENKFLKELRKLGVEYAFFREWQKPGRGRHVHLAVISNGVKLSKRRLKKFWRDLLPEGAYRPVYASPVENVVGLAKYLPKDIKGKVVVPRGTSRGGSSSERTAS